MQRITFFFILLGLFASPIQARDDDRYHHGDKWRVDTPKREVWVEGTVEYPTYPQEENLVEYRIPAQKANYRYLLNTESISVGDNGVARYIIVRDSGSGSRSVVFEGINCKSRKYRPYAYGIRGEQLQRRKKSTWMPIVQARGSVSYRQHLMDDLLCSGDGNPNSRDKILPKLTGQ
jgi:hypothetical protein